MSAAPAQPAPQPTMSVLDIPSADWDPFVLAHPDASVYLLSGWAQLAHEVFGHSAFFLEAREADGRLNGVLALVRQRGILGDFMTSLPFFNYGGAFCSQPQVALELMQRGQALAEQLGCSYVEYRDVEPRVGQWRVRTDKVTMILPLPADRDTFAKQLGSKLRSQIKRTEREQAVVRKGGEELLDAFYGVFSENMRDLGTPVYPKRFFRAVLNRFPDKTRIVVIDHGSRPAAAGFLIRHVGRTEIPWAACCSHAKPLGFNMKLYWEVLVDSIEQGCSSFDFGRSTPDTGTYRFKKQWGAQPLQLHWHRWERGRSVGDADATASLSDSGVMRLATAAWKKLPLRIANLLGPWLSPGLPW